MKNKFKYSIYSEDNNKIEGDKSGYLYGKLRFIWWILTNKYKKEYRKRNKIEVTIYF